MFHYKLIATDGYDDNAEVTLGHMNKYSLEDIRTLVEQSVPVIMQTLSLENMRDVDISPAGWPYILAEYFVKNLGFTYENQDIESYFFISDSPSWHNYTDLSEDSNTNTIFESAKNAGFDLFEIEERIQEIEEEEFKMMLEKEEND